MTDDRLARVADELEIRNTIARIAMLADHGDLDEYQESSPRMRCGTSRSVPGRVGPTSEPVPRNAGPVG